MLRVQKTDLGCSWTWLFQKIITFGSWIGRTPTYIILEDLMWLMQEVELFNQKSIQMRKNLFRNSSWLSLVTDTASCPRADFVNILTLCSVSEYKTTNNRIEVLLDLIFCIRVAVRVWHLRTIDYQLLRRRTEIWNSSYKLLYLRYIHLWASASILNLSVRIYFTIWASS